MKPKTALKTIETGFEKAVKKGLLADMTYYGKIRNFVNNGLPKIVEREGDERLYNPKHWKGWMVEEWIDNLIDRYHNDEVVATYVEGTVHAFAKLQELVKDHKVLGKGIPKVRVGLKGSIKEGTGYLNKLHEEGVIDNKDDVTSMKPSENNPELTKIIENIDKVIPTTHVNYDSVVNVLTSQYYTGGRIAAEVNLKVKDIDLEKNIKLYDKDKHDFTRRTPIEEEHRSFFSNLVSQKASGAEVFPFKRSNGTDMSKEEKVKFVSEILREAAIKSGINYINEEGKEIRYTTHSSRRGYGQKLYDGTRHWSRAKIETEIANYVNLQGSNKEKILKRIENENTRLNYYRIKKGLPKKDFTWEQLRRLYVALHLGHSRIDVVSRYVNLDPHISQMRSKK